LQYQLTLTPIVEIRTRIETHTRTVTEIDSETGEEYEIEEEYQVEVEFEYHILEVRLTNTSLGRVVTPLLTQEELEMYRVYMETHGNKPHLFEDHPHANRREWLHYYAAPDPSKPTHVGIYVGNNMMIHAGNPISYVRTDTNYWIKHFYGFGRLP
jgi:hypothetical protein